MSQMWRQMTWETIRPSWPPFRVWQMIQEAKRPFIIQFETTWPETTWRQDQARMLMEYRVGLSVMSPPNLLTISCS